MLTTPAFDKLDAFGIEAVCDHILNGVTLLDISKTVGVDLSALIRWLDADLHRSARAREARIKAAFVWDEMAVQELRNAQRDPVEMTRAREIASHYRWRASKIAPKQYGDKVQHTGEDGSGPVRVVYSWDKDPENDGSS